MNLLRLINLSLAHVYYSNYCSNLVSNHSLIMLIRFVSQFTSNLCNSFFLDLILYACKILFQWDRFEILNFATKQDLWTRNSKSRSNRSVVCQTFREVLSLSLSVFRSPIVSHLCVCLFCCCINMWYFHCAMEIEESSIQKEKYS